MFEHEKKLQFVISETLAEAVKCLMGDKRDDLDQVDGEQEDAKITLVVDYHQVQEFEEHCKDELADQKVELLSISFN